MLLFKPALQLPLPNLLDYAFHIPITTGEFPSCSAVSHSAAGTVYRQGSLLPPPTEVIELKLPFNIENSAASVSDAPSPPEPSHMSVPPFV